jgi:CRP/FNR family transcriptional regulator, cyclic AMP receptor protein
MIPSSTLNFPRRSNTMTGSGAWFSHLRPEAQGLLDQIGTTVQYERGTVLFQESEPLEIVYILCSGKVKLSVASRDGRTIILRLAHAGEVLGLSAALSERPYESTAETLEPCTCKAVPRADFMRFLEQCPEASIHVARVLAAECQTATSEAQLLGLTTSSAGRMAKLLLQWSDRAPDTTPHAPRLMVSLTHEELGAMAGVARETVTRTLAQFRRDKLIAIKGIALTILQPRALEQLAA